jgi:HTH-type transcriptional regulator/antitoxin HigA
MKIRILKSEEEYEKACSRIYDLIHSMDDPIEPDSEEGEELELLSLLVEKYEQKNYSLGAPDPVEAIKFRMEQMGLRQSDIAPLFGGKTRVSEVLNRKRPLTLRMIVLLNRYLGIPLESLVLGNKDVALDEENREKLLNIAPIRHYLRSNRILIEDKKTRSHSPGRVKVRPQTDMSAFRESEGMYRSESSSGRPVKSKKQDIRRKRKGSG